MYLLFCIFISSVCFVIYVVVTRWIWRVNRIVNILEKFTFHFIEIERQNQISIEQQEEIIRLFRNGDLR
jgi:hypothetical protein